MASTYLSLYVHIVFATKGRDPMILNSWLGDLHAYIGGTVRGLGATPLAIGGVADHVHVLAGVRGTHSIADLVREVKRASSVWAADRNGLFAWQEGYGAFSVSRWDLDALRTYIGRQVEHHENQSSVEELRALLLEHGVEFDERFFE